MKFVYTKINNFVNKLDALSGAFSSIEHTIIYRPTTTSPKESFVWK